MPWPKGKPKNPASGRKKNGLNKDTKPLREMILGALSAVGGQSYLEGCALDPKLQPSFLGLIGKVLPLQVGGDPSGSPIHVTLSDAKLAAIAASKD